MTKNIVGLILIVLIVALGVFLELQSNDYFSSDRRPAASPNPAPMPPPMKR